MFKEVLVSVIDALNQTCICKPVNNALMHCPGSIFCLAPSDGDTGSMIVMLNIDIASEANFENLHFL